MADLSRIIDSLTPHQRELLELRLRRQRQKEQATVRDEAAEPAGAKTYPASYSQQRLWFLEKAQPGNPAHLLRAGVRLSRRPEDDALQRSVDRLVARHEILRSSFPESEGYPVQSVGEAQTTPIIHSEAPVSGFPESMTSRFRLCKGGLVRLMLSPDGQGGWELRACMHRIIGDESSADSFFRQLADLYEEETQGTSSVQVGEPLQQGELAGRERQALPQEKLEERMKYWGARFRQLPLLRFAEARPRSKASAFRAASLDLQIQDDRWIPLRALAGRLEADLWELLHTAWALSVGLAGSGRGLCTGIVECEPRVEAAAQPLGHVEDVRSVHSPLDLQRSFSQVLQTLRASYRESRSNQGPRYDVLVEALQPERNRSRTPLLQALFRYRPSCRWPLTRGGLRWSRLPGGDATQPFDLRLTVEGDEGAVACGLEFDAAVLDGGYAGRIAERFRAILDQACRDPELPLEDWPPQAIAPDASTSSSGDLGQADEALDRWDAQASPFLKEMVERASGRRPAASISKSLPDEVLEICPQQKGGKPPFFCVHAMSGSASVYYDLSKRLGADQSFFGFQARGLNGKKPPLESIEEMAGCYLEHLIRIQPEAPYYLGGWSFGTLVAVEMARMLVEQKRRVAFLGSVDMGTNLSQIIDFDDSAQLLVNMVSYFTNELPLAVSSLRRLAPDRQLSFVWEQLRLNRLVPPGFEMGAFQAYFDVYQAHCIAAKNYRFRPYPGHVTLFRAGEQLAHVEQSADLGWKELALEGVSLHVVPGNHYTCTQEPQVRVLAQRLKTCLEKSRLAAAVA